VYLVYFDDSCPSDRQPDSRVEGWPEAPQENGSDHGEDVGLVVGRLLAVADQSLPVAPCLHNEPKCVKIGGKLGQCFQALAQLTPSPPPPERQ
jgi:hypothetical protein